MDVQGYRRVCDRSGWSGHRQREKCIFFSIKKKKIFSCLFPLSGWINAGFLSVRLNSSTCDASYRLDGISFFKKVKAIDGLSPLFNSATSFFRFSRFFRGSRPRETWRPKIACPSQPVTSLIQKSGGNPKARRHVSSGDPWHDLHKEHHLDSSVTRSDSYDFAQHIITFGKDYGRTRCKKEFRMIIKCFPLFYSCQMVSFLLHFFFLWLCWRFYQLFSRHNSSSDSVNSLPSFCFNMIFFFAATNSFRPN